ncbi:MAG: glycosyltransferase family 39 protein, partial [Gaiellaceae bacterium]
QMSARPLASLERLASRRLGAAVLFVLALGVYGVRAIGWPLVAGRDLDEYLYGYIQFLDWHPLLPWSMLFRTPPTPIVTGAALDVGGGALAEPLMAVLFAGSVVAWAAAARFFGVRAALLVAAALLVYPAYGLMFHELSSEPLFAAAFALWAWLVTRAAGQPSARRFALVGLGVALLAFVRPGNAVLVVFAAFPFLLAGDWRRRVRWVGALLVAAALPLAAWAVLNGVRFGDYTLARGGNAVVPFYRAFITDRIVEPDNGPASRRLANAIRLHLLTRDPYKSYGVTLDKVFSSGSFRIHEDLYVLSDEVFGWDSDYSVLRDTGREAVQQHPGKYTSGVLDTVWQQLSKSFFRSPPSRQPTQPEPMTEVGGRELPRPTEGQPIPAGQNAWISTPDNRIRDVWTSATHHHFAFRYATDRPRFNEILRQRDALFRALPDRRGNSTLALRLNQLSRWFPRPIVWIVLGLIGLAWRRPRGMATLTAIALAALLVIVLNALGLFADPHFALPVAPAFILFGAGALLGRRA